MFRSSCPPQHLANRLVRVECLDADGKVIRTIEYGYDAFHRQVIHTGLLPVHSIP